MNEPASFVCPRCQAVSYNPNDIRECYCGACHQFADDAQPAADMSHNPVSRVLWVPLEKIFSNNYNPNSVALMEMRLLYISIKHDGTRRHRPLRRTGAEVSRERMGGAQSAAGQISWSHAFRCVADARRYRGPQNPQSQESLSVIRPAFDRSG